jgi:hypothetical protein
MSDGMILMQQKNMCNTVVLLYSVTCIFSFRLTIVFVNTQMYWYYESDGRQPFSQILPQLSCHNR